MRYCFNCERKCRDEDNYCSNCGAKLEYEHLTPLDYPSTNSRLSPPQPLEIPPHAIHSSPKKVEANRSAKPVKRKVGLFRKILRSITFVLIVMLGFYVYLKLNPDGWFYRSGILVQQDVHNDPIFWILGLILAAVMGIILYIFSFVPKLLRLIP